ncbi:MAG: cell division protein FtsL [Halioglobus sp.]
MAKQATQEKTAHAGKPWLLANTFLVGVVLAAAFSNIYSTHACRALYAQLQSLESTQWYLQEDYGRLLLEQSTWASHHRVEKVARKNLNMRAPDLALFEVVAQ